MLATAKDKEGSIIDSLDENEATNMYDFINKVIKKEDLIFLYFHSPFINRKEFRTDIRGEVQGRQVPIEQAV